MQQQAALLHSIEALGHEDWDKRQWVSLAATGNREHRALAALEGSFDKDFCVAQHDLLCVAPEQGAALPQHARTRGAANLAWSMCVASGGCLQQVPIGSISIIPPSTNANMKHGFPSLLEKS